LSAWCDCWYWRHCSHGGEGERIKNYKLFATLFK
jgi:hypothetical protein